MPCKHNAACMLPPTQQQQGMLRPDSQCTSSKEGAAHLLALRQLRPYVVAKLIVQVSCVSHAASRACTRALLPGAPSAAASQHRPRRGDRGFGCSGSLPVSCCRPSTLLRPLCEHWAALLARQLLPSLRDGDAQRAAQRQVWRGSSSSDAGCERGSTVAEPSGACLAPAWRAAAENLFLLA